MHNTCINLLYILLLSLLISNYYQMNQKESYTIRNIFFANFNIILEHYSQRIITYRKLTNSEISD